MSRLPSAVRRPPSDGSQQPPAVSRQPCTMCGTTSGCDGCPIASDFYLSESLASLEVGAKATVRRLASAKGGDLRRLLALGVLPGVELEVERHWPAMVLRMGYATVALDAGLAEGVVVSR